MNFILKSSNRPKMSTRKGFPFDGVQSPRESEITTFTENTTSQSVPSLRSKAISLIFIDSLMEKNFKNWTVDKYARFHIFLYGIMLIWISLLFVIDFLVRGQVAANYFRIGYYGIAIIGILVTKLTKRYNDIVMIVLSSVILVLSTADDVVAFNKTSEFSQIESNWFPMLIILHSSMSLAHIRYWLLILVIPMSYITSICLSRSFYKTSKVIHIHLELVRYTNIMAINHGILYIYFWVIGSISTTLFKSKFI